MTPEQYKMAIDGAYELGYHEGRANRTASLPRTWTLEEQETYEAGWIDGQGEYQSALGVRPVDAAFREVNVAPPGFEYTGEKRVAQDGEYYLTKNGNAKQQVGQRGNAQTRHILRRV
jgi:hypothetical protein